MGMKGLAIGVIFGKAVVNSLDKPPLFIDPFIAIIFLDHPESNVLPAASS
jgi:hypothetical protein